MGQNPPSPFNNQNMEKTKQYKQNLEILTMNGHTDKRTKILYSNRDLKASALFENIERENFKHG